MAVCEEYVYTKGVSLVMKTEYEVFVLDNISFSCSSLTDAVVADNCVSVKTYSRETIY